MSTATLRTPLYEVHRQEGAKIVDFAGWDMPIEYTGIKNEHLAVRTDAGLFDLSHMGELEVKGAGAFDWIQGLITNDLARCADFQCQYSTMCNEQGRVLDDLITYRFSRERFILVVNASNREKIFNYMKGQVPADVQLTDLSMQTALIAIQGPNAQKKLQPHTSLDLESIKYYHFAMGDTAVLGKTALVSRTGYTGDDGFEIYVPNAQAEELWKALRADGVPAIGLGARDTLRLESGYSLYGHEIDEQTTPLEAGLAWVTRLDKPAFVGKQALVDQKAQGVPRTVVGLLMEGRAIPREGYRVLRDGTDVGRVTSGTYSPSLSKGIALASVESSCRPEGTVLQVDVRGRGENAKVVRPPFVAGSVRRN